MASSSLAATTMATVALLWSSSSQISAADGRMWRGEAVPDLQAVPGCATRLRLGAAPGQRVHAGRTAAAAGDAPSPCCLQSADLLACHYCRISLGFFNFCARFFGIFLGWIDASEFCVLMKTWPDKAMGRGYEAEAGVQRGVHGERHDAMSGSRLGSQSCLSLSALLLCMLLFFLLTQFCFVYMLHLLRPFD